MLIFADVGVVGMMMRCGVIVCSTSFSSSSSRTCVTGVEGGVPGGKADEVDIGVKGGAAKVEGVAGR